MFSQAASGQLADIVADIRTGRLQWLKIHDESLSPLIPLLNDLPSYCPMRLSVMVGDEQQLRPILAAAAPFIQTLFLVEPRRAQKSKSESEESKSAHIPLMVSFPYMPRLQSLVCRVVDGFTSFSDAAISQRMIRGLLVPHAATLRHIVFCKLPDFREDRYLSHLGDALRSMSQLESLVISPYDLRLMYLRNVARFAIFGRDEDDLDTYHSTSPLVPLPASLTAVSIVLVQDYGRPVSARARFLPDPEHLPRTVRRVCFFQNGRRSPEEEVRSAVARLFEALPAVQVVENRTMLEAYERGDGGVLVIRSIKERSFHDYDSASVPIDHVCAEIERMPGGWNELGINPYINPVTEAARRCDRILHLVVSSDYHHFEARGAAAVVPILAAHPEMRELSLYMFSTVDDEACALIIAAVRAHPHLRFVRVPRYRRLNHPPPQWKQMLLKAVLETNAGRRQRDQDRAAWSVVIVGVHRSIQMVAAGWRSPNMRQALPLHMHSISGRVADYLGNTKPEQLTFVENTEDEEYSNSMQWFVGSVL